nr:reverse transcriptase domain-containing protein [Tanacetum cinerariifolium]
MAARTVKDLGNYRGRRALYKSVDEFYDSEVTITIKWHHWKAWDKRNLSSTIHDSWNAQIPAVRHDMSTAIDCRELTQHPRRIFTCQTEEMGISTKHVHKIVIPFQKSIGKSNPFAATPLSVSWTPTKATIKYRWPNRMRERQLSTPVMGAISAVLMTERNTVQTPVYFMSRVLQAPELNYTPKEKLALALVYVDKRIRIYFQAYPIVILADFLVKKPDDAPPHTSVIETPQEPWILFMNGSSCVDGLGVGLILTSPDGMEFTYALRFQFAASNNEAEYEELIAGLLIAAQMGVHNVPTRKGQVFDSRYGLFHKVDRSESSGNNHRRSSEEVRVGQHSMPVRSPRRNSLGQRMPIYRTAVVDTVHNNKELWLNLDLLEERRECVAIREAKAKLKMTKYYNTRVRGVTFRHGDFVYRSNEASHAMNGRNLGPK